MVMEDLQAILPEQFKQLSQRKLVVGLAALSLILAVICVVLLALVGVSHTQGGLGGSGASASAQSSGGPRTCLTVTCLKSSAWLASNMDTTVKPCEDFYRWACGGWEKRTSLPPNTYRMSLLNQIREDNDEKLRELIDSPIKSSTPSSSERKLKQFFQMCMHDYGRMQQGAGVLIDRMRTDLGTWYVLDPTGWKDSWNLDTALVSAHTDYLVDALMGVTVYPDSRDYSKNIITVRFGGMGMWYGYYHREDQSGLQDAYKDYMRAVASLALRDANITDIDAGEKEQRIEQFVADAYYQESHLAKAIVDGRMQSGWWQSTVFKVRELSQNVTQVDWKVLLTRMFPSYDINDDTEVQVRSIKYFAFMDELLRNETTEGDRDRILHNYLIWQVLSWYSYELSWEYKYASFRFTEVMYGITEFGSTWEHCMDTVKARLGSALAAEFIKTHIGFEGRKGVQTMFGTMKQALNYSVEGLGWMDENTKDLAQEKLKYMEGLIGFPDSYFNETFVDNLHSDLLINDSISYFENILNTNHFYRKMQALKLNAGRTYYLWNYALRSGGFGTRPVYFWSYNKLLVPAGTIQFPLYSSDMPHFMKFGALGSRMGQEMMNSINEIGRFDWLNGSFIDWWSMNTTGEYNIRKACYQNAFLKLKAGPYLINGENVTIPLKGEWQAGDLADTIAGIKIAYQAYKTELLQNEDLHPPGLNLTSSQAFFLSAAQMQCSKRRMENSYVNLMTRYGWVPHNLMFNTALTHTKEFHDAFQCPKDAKMKSDQICELW